MEQHVMILDGRNHIALKGECAELVKANYEKFTEPQSETRT